MGSIMATNISRQEYEAACLTVSADRGQEEASPGAQFHFSFFFSLTPEPTE